jgi:hypothetical protein
MTYSAPTPSVRERARHPTARSPAASGLRALPLFTALSAAFSAVIPAALAATLVAGWVNSAEAQGISPLGASGGLVVPKARPIPEGTIETSVSNLPEPGLQGAARQRSIVLGFGVLPGVEVSGRFAEYATRVGGSLMEPGSFGISDLSLNGKVGWAWGDGPTALRLGAGVSFVACNLSATASSLRI